MQVSVCMYVYVCTYVYVFKCMYVSVCLCVYMCMWVGVTCDYEWVLENLDRLASTASIIRLMRAFLSGHLPFDTRYINHIPASWFFGSICSARVPWGFVRE